MRKTLNKDKKQNASSHLTHGSRGHVCGTSMDVVALCSMLSHGRSIIYLAINKMRNLLMLGLGLLKIVGVLNLSAAQSNDLLSAFLVVLEANLVSQSSLKAHPSPRHLLPTSRPVSAECRGAIAKRKLPVRRAYSASWRRAAF